jgi:hypothetical protein
MEAVEVYELSNKDYKIVDKIKYIYKLINSTLPSSNTENNFNNNNINNFSNNKTYNGRESINKFVKFKEDYFKNVKGKIIDDEGKIDPENDVFDFAVFKQDFDRVGKLINIFIKSNNSYYQINYNYLYNKFSSTLPNNFETKSSLIYITFYNILSDIIKNLLDKTTYENNKIKFNKLITSLYLLMAQSYNADFLFMYYYKLYNLLVNSSDSHYTNYIIDTDIFNVYKLTNSFFVIPNTNNEDIITNTDQCNEYNKCAYHVIKSYINNENKLNFISFTLNENTDFKLDNNNPEPIQVDSLPYMKFNKKLLLYTQYSSDLYKNLSKMLTIKKTKNKNPNTNTNTNHKPRLPRLYKTHKKPNRHIKYTKLQNVNDLENVHNLITFIDI